MDIQQLLTEVDHLDEEALAQLKQQIARREEELHTQKHPQTAQEWSVVIDQFLDDFCADTPTEEQKAVVEAIRHTREINYDEVVRSARRD